MIELGIFHNGATWAEPVEVNGVLVTSGDLAATQEARRRTLLDQVRQGILADRLGFETFWLTEHHFQPEGPEFSPNPLLTQTAIAARTRRIRLGQNANILTWWHPLRLAEQVAILDVISGGRAEVGIGRGYQPRESETLGRPYGTTVQDQERNRSYYEEAYSILLKAWTEPSFSHHGEFFSIPPTYTKWNHRATEAYFAQPGVGRSVEDVVRVGPPDMYSSGLPIVATTSTLRELSVYPQPVQRPHPQIWEPTTSERSIRWAARNGINGFFIAEPNGRLRRVVETYYEEAERAGWPDRLGRGAFRYGWDAERRRGCVAGRWVHLVSGGAGDERKAMRGLQMQWDWYAPFGFGGALSEGDEPRLDPWQRIPAERAVEKKVALIGSPDYVIEEILRVRDAVGGDDFNFVSYFELAGFAGEEIEEQMQVFAEEVMPVLRRECGGAPVLPESDVDLDPGVPQAAPD